MCFIHDSFVFDFKRANIVFIWICSYHFSFLKIILWNVYPQHLPLHHPYINSVRDMYPCGNSANARNIQRLKGPPEFFEGFNRRLKRSPEFFGDFNRRLKRPPEFFEAFNRRLKRPPDFFEDFNRRLTPCTRHIWLSSTSPVFRSMVSGRN
jgi:hypothetical protein